MIKLEHYRLFKGMTVYGLSKATGISRRHISKIETGQSSPTADKIIAICLVLDITPNESVNRNTDTKFNIKATPEHLGKVRSAYLSILDENNLIYINGMQSIENIFGEVVEKIEELRKNNERRI